MKLIPQKLVEGWSYRMVKISFLTSTVLDQCTRVTGRRTGGP